MADTFARTVPNIMHSVFEWLRSVSYTAAAVTGTLKDHFAGLQIVSAYPDDLTQLIGPVLAPGGPLEIISQDETYGDGEEHLYAIAIAGIVLGQGSDVQNRLYRDGLMNDVYRLLRRAVDEGIPLYDAATNTLVGNETLEVDRVRARQVPANALEIEADRFKFTVEAEIAVVVSA